MRGKSIRIGYGKLKLLGRQCQPSRPAVVAAALLGIFAYNPALRGQETVETIAQIAPNLDAEFSQLQQRQPSELAALAQSISQHLNELKLRSVMLIGERKRHCEELDQQLRGTLGDCNSSSVAQRDQARAKAREIWTAIKAQYPAEALTLMPALWSCPMHQELMEARPGSCPVCGMSLEPIYITQPQLSTLPIIRAEIVTPPPLERGKPANLRIRFVFNSDNKPVELDELEESHTQKVHLLIVDLSQTDYHHEHPEHVAPGEYAFSFTPRKSDTYRVWADLKPARTHVEQYSVADIPSTTPHQNQLNPDEPENRHAEIDGYRFDLTFGAGVLHDKETVLGRLYVTGADGEPCSRLQVVMGAFAHFVGFRDDFSTVLHVHPVGQQPQRNEALGGPELSFYFRSNAPGVVRFFAQVKIDGRDFFPRFVVRVQPLQHLPGL